ncbi:MULTISPECIES: YfhD family protein [Fictibacillus]|uniref:YfhD family protein n=1 Tax=Fictibacillus TaxID=1329200 RepID=UPI00041DC1EF|nr:YfhD family protein [Fictibacillus gelatini]
MTKKQDMDKLLKRAINYKGLSDGLDVEYSEELADEDDLEAKGRAEAADQRQKSSKKH